MDMVCYESGLLRMGLLESVCYGHGLLWTWSVMDMVCYGHGLLRTGLLGSVGYERVCYERSVMNMACNEQDLLGAGL